MNMLPCLVNLRAKRAKNVITGQHASGHPVTVWWPSRGAEIGITLPLLSVPSLFLYLKLSLRVNMFQQKVRVKNGYAHSGGLRNQKM